MRVAEGAADREACFAVRKEVFVVEQGVPEDIEYDAYDAGPCTYWPSAGRAGRSAPGGCCTAPAAAAKTGGDPAVGSLGRLAVTREARGLGVGAALVRAIEARHARVGLAAVDLDAQTHALGLLRAARIRGLRPGVRGRGNAAPRDAQVAVRPGTAVAAWHA